tara:strand:- start:2660 stop:2968 length:309 start_codon:yes stop_codon:yes gene_type:complete
MSIPRRKYNKYSTPSLEWERKLILYCNFISDRLKSYLAKKNMTTKDLSKKIDIKHNDVKLMLNDVYVYNFSIEEMSKLDLLFEGHYDIYEKELLIEKKIKRR